jgi:hypothetical protein
VNSWFATCSSHVFKDPQGIAGPLDLTQVNAISLPGSANILQQDVFQLDQKIATPEQLEGMVRAGIQAGVLKE